MLELAGQSKELKIVLGVLLIVATAYTIMHYHYSIKLSKLKIKEAQ